MRREALVSIIMPAFNAEAFIAEAIASVLVQTYVHWELLIVNDGSTDGTARVIERFTDARIRVFEQPNGGIGSARNLALGHVHGEFLGFLDADDVLPPNSVQARVDLLNARPEVDIADGWMIEKNGDLTVTMRTFRPTYRGHPFKELVRLNGSCFGGVSWLLRWPVSPPVKFQADTSQMEDLLFLLAYSQPGRRYGYVDEPVLIYRRGAQSSTSDLAGMERSYRFVHRWLVKHEWASAADLSRFRRRSRRVIFASWLHAGRPFRAMRSLLIPFS